MKIAILFRGGVSKKSGNYARCGDIDIKSEFVNYESAYTSFKTHILKPNKEHEIDTFIHSWHPELKDELIRLYNPKKILLEENKNYADEIIQKVNFSQVSDIGYAVVSHALSLKKVSNLVTEYSQENNVNYDLILIYRLDILLIADLIFNKYNPFHITCSNFQDCIGEFHFVMNYENMIQFCKVYDFFSPKLKPICHFYFPDYVRNYMGRILEQDDIVAGVHQEALRKATTLLDHRIISPDFLLRYGITEKEIRSYVH